MLSFDVCRCVGIKDDAGELATPCRNCRRLQEADPRGPETPVMSWPPPILNAMCYYLIPMRVEANAQTQQVPA